MFTKLCSYIWHGYQVPQTGDNINCMDLVHGPLKNKTTTKYQQLDCETPQVVSLFFLVSFLCVSGLFFLFQKLPQTLVLQGL